MKLRYLFIPLLLGFFIFIFQNCAKSPYLGQNKELLSLEMRQYYLVQDGYTCVTLAGDTVDSYADSLYFLDGNVCFTGDSCSDNVKCNPWPEGLVVSQDLLTVNYNGKIYYFMKTEPTAQ